jgi:hypothetical protein
MKDKQVFKDQAEVACQKCWNAHLEELEKSERAYTKLRAGMSILEAEVDYLKTMVPRQEKKKGGKQ